VQEGDKSKGEKKEEQGSYGTCVCVGKYTGLGKKELGPLSDT